MTPQRWQNVKSLFDAAVEMPPAEAVQFLRGACRSDSDLYEEIRQMLDANGKSGFLDRPAIHPEPPALGYSLDSGSVIAGRYRIVRALGRGGMGEVYEAEDLELKERVALKTLLPEIAADGRMIARFKQEIRLSRKIAHANVCRVFDLARHPTDGSSPNSIFFLTMELLQGETVRERLRRENLMTAAESLPLVQQMAQALDAAHSVGVIHRDFKASNVMLVGTGDSTRAVVTDFGLARRAHTPDDSTATITGSLMGTVDYMAPELFTGKDASVASDVYALGVVMYEMVTGRKPFAADTPLASAVKRMSEAVPAPGQVVPELPPPWNDVILRCLERDPAKRFHAARKVAEVLTGTPATPSSVFERMQAMKQWPTTTRRVACAVIGIGALALALLGIRAVGRHRPPSQAVRWYEEGVHALRDGTSFRAMNSFQRAVEIDPAFVLAHARLAEAATDLDYMDKAKSEMLRASPPALQLYFLSSEEKWRLQAVYFVLVKDFANAAAKYKELADHVSFEERASVLVDLGRAYESDGKFQEALASYTESIAKDNQFAAAFLRRAELEGRQRLNDNASKDFDAAEQLYRSESNSEGITEVSYQKALLLRRIGKLAEARPFVENSLERARSDRDEFHQVKALLMLSFLLYNSGDTDAGEQRAKEAIELARRAGLESLSASGLAEVGMALFIKGDNRGAESYLRDALETAKRFQDLQVQARAEMTLEQVLMKTGHPEEAFALLKDAMQQLEEAGDKSGNARAAILAARILRDRGDYDQAALLFRQGLDLAERAKDQGTIALSAQGLGAVLLLLEKYPEALANFTRSADLTHTIGDPGQEAYSHLTRADALRFLGRYTEASEELGKAEQLDEHRNAGKPLLVSINFSRAEMDLSRLKLAEAEHDIRGMEKASNQIILASAKRLLGLQRLESGRVREGLALCHEAENMAKSLGDIALLKNSELALAQAKLASGDKVGALELALGLLAYFSEKGKHESELRTLAILIEASRNPERDQYVQRAKASLAKLGSDFAADFPGFAARPDIHQIIKRLGLTSDVQ